MPSSKYEEKFVQMVQDHLAQGHSFTSFAGVIKVSPSTIEKWTQNKPEFAEAVAIGRAAGMIHWEKSLMGMASGKMKGNPAAAIFAMKNLYPGTWRDKQEVEQTVDVKVTDARERLEHLINRYAAATSEGESTPTTH